MRMMLLTVGAALAAATMPAIPAQAAPPPGTYLQSCNSVRDQGRGLMSAQCRSVNGRYRYSTLDYSGCRGDIGNNDGQLICTGGRPGGPGGPGGPGNGWGGGGDWGRLPGGSWRETCRPGDVRGPMLTARCQGVQGRWFDTGIDLRSCRSNRLANRNGRLVCDR